MINTTRLRVPTFDLVWLEDDLEGISYLLAPGGGGSARSGVRNQVQIIRRSSKYGFDLIGGIETDTEGRNFLCSGVSSGEILVC